MKRLLVYSEIIKHLPRTGWKRKGVPEPETVASHSWQMALMALYLSQGNALEYDFDKVIKLCLCHDLAESKLGDITTIDAAYYSKAVRETAAMDEIAVEADFPAAAELFAEYEAGETPEAQLASDLDKLDMYVQSLDYEQKFPDKDLEEFRRSAAAGIKTALGRNLLRDLQNREEPLPFRNMPE